MGSGTALAVIGGGASGLNAAIASARCGEQVILLEKNQQLGKKLLATGNGRCNLMNRNPACYEGDRAFAEAVLGANPVETLEAWWHSLGLYLRYDPEGRGYPCTLMAQTVLEVLKAEIRRLGISVYTGIRIRDVRREGDGFLLKPEDGEALRARRVILSTGGAAQPKLGGNRDAWPWLESMGHPMKSAQPSLTPLEALPKSVSGLAGLRIRGDILLETEGRTVQQEKGELLFTEDGISGICVMQCSRNAVPGKSVVLLNTVSDLFQTPEELLDELRRRGALAPEEGPVELLRGMIPAKMAYAVCKQAGLPLRGEKNRDLHPGELRRIADTAMAYRIPVTGKKDFDRAQVMAGGADCGLLDPENMESRIQPGLHLTGELTNVDGGCGGYNLMYAVMSGLKAGWNRRNSGKDRIS